MIHWYHKIPIFAGLEEAALLSLAQAAQIVTYEKDAIIFRQGETGNTLYLIESGEVEVIEAFETPQQKVLATLGQGEFFGEMAILECSRRSATLRTCSPSVLHQLTNADLYRFFRASPEQYAILILNIARDLARRLHRLDEEFVYRHSQAPPTLDPA